MEIHLTIAGRGNVVGQIYSQLRAAILEGRLPGGMTLPSSRELAKSVAVSRNSVVTAYERLASEGFVEARVGVGTVVRKGLAFQRSPRPRASPLRARGIWDRVPEGLVMSTSLAPYDFRPGVPEVNEFPFAAFRTRLAASMRLRDGQSGGHIDAAGDLSLRREISRHIGVSRAVVSTPDNIIITNGSQQALDLIVRVLAEPGDTVAVEDPGYPPARRVFSLHGCKVVGVPVDLTGIRVSDLPHEARIVYVTPSHQYPLGGTMAIERRQRLLEWARARNAAIIEDDYDSEFRFGGHPLEPLHALDDSGHVLYVGSLSKMLLPNLRLGYVVVPDTLSAAFRKAKHVADWHTTVPLQVAVARFMEDGLLVAYTRRMLRAYEERRTTILQILNKEFAGLLEPIPGHGGLHVAAFFVDPSRNDQAVVHTAERHDVHCFALSRNYEFQAPRNGLILGYGAIQNADIPEGLRRIREIFATGRD